MRMRTVKPEFWRDERVGRQAHEHRLLLIGLYSYVDDNGVGIDDYRQVAADLFALDDDPREAREKVREGLASLSRGFLITRYTVDGVSYLYVNNWTGLQKIDKPNRPRYPEPTHEDASMTCDDDGRRETLARPSRDPREGPSTGTGEQGNRGTGEKDTSAATANTPDEPDPFDAFWTAYPRKDNKQTARKAWTKAAKQHGPDKLLEEIHRWSGLWEQAGIEKRFIPHAATWLNGQRWEDEPPPPRLKAVSGDPEDWTDAPRIPWWQQ